MEEEEYFCQHKEADTRIIFYLENLPLLSNVIICTVDTDLLVIHPGYLYIVKTL